MKNLFTVEDQTDAQLTRIGSTFNTLLNILRKESSQTAQRENHLFAIAFGLNFDGIELGDLFTLLEYKSATTSANQEASNRYQLREIYYSKLNDLMAANGAPHAGIYIRRHLSGDEAKFLFDHYSKPQNQADLRKVRLG